MLDQTEFHRWYAAYVKYLPYTDTPPAHPDTVHKNHIKILDKLTKKGMPPEIRKQLHKFIIICQSKPLPLDL